MTVAESTPEEGMAALAETAVRSGKTNIVGVGGDGTHHDALNGIVRSGGLGTVTYVPLPLGTGNDWVRTLKTPKDARAWLEMLHAGKTIQHHVGRLDYLSAEKPDELIDPNSNDENGQARTSYFINVAGLAYDAVVVQRSETSRFKHPWLYPLLTLLYLKDFVPPVVKVTYDDGTYYGPVHTINIGIGRYSGGGMRLVPHADPTADSMALTYAERLPVWKILLSSWRFYTGTVGAIGGVTTTHTKQVLISPGKDLVALEADGELLGGAPVTVSLHGGCLRVVVP